MNIHSNIYFILDWLFITSCKGVAAILLVLLLRKILANRITPQGRYLLWIPVIACFVMPFGWHVSYPSLDSWNNNQTPIVLESPSIRIQPAGMTLGDKDPATSTHSITDRFNFIQRINDISPELIKQAFIVLWLAGIVTLSLVVVRNVVRYSRIRYSAKQVRGVSLELFNDCKETMCAKESIELRESSAITSPIITGWWNPVLLLPERLDQQLLRNEMRHVFLHELCHVKRLDLPMSWLITVVQILNWFNPLVWYMGRQFRTDMEAACDAMVLGTLKDNDRTAYGHTLIKLSEPPATGTLITCGAGIMERYSQLKARIIMINQFDPPTLRKSAGAMFALFLIMPLTCLQPIAVSASGKAQQSKTIVLTSEIVTTQPTTSTETSWETPVVPQNASAQQKSISVIKKMDTTAADQTGIQELHTLYIKVEHTNASDLAAFVRPETGLSLLSNHGSVAVDTRTNSLLVHDKQENIEAVKQLVARLDIPMKKVMIEARMVLVDSSAIAALMTRAKAGQTPANHQPPDIDTHQLVSRVSKSFNVDAEISSLQAANKGEIVSSPKVLTEVRKEAVIQQGIVVPTTATGDASGAAQSSSRLLVNLTLQSNITPESKINFGVSFSRETTAPPPPPPSSDKQVWEKRIDDKIKIITTELMNDGETVMLTDNYDHQKLKSGKRLLIFLTPKIMNEDGSFNL